MGIHPSWREPFHDRWWVAQVRADLGDVSKVVRATKGVKEIPLVGDSPPFSVSKRLQEFSEPTFLYRREGSAWTFIEAFFGAMPLDLSFISSKLDVDVLTAQFDDSVGVAGCSWMRGGSVARELSVGPPDFLDPKSDLYDARSLDGIGRTWQSSADHTARWFDAGGGTIDLDHLRFEDYWDSISTELEVDVPPLCFGIHPETSKIILDPEVSGLDEKSIRLFD